LITSLIPLVLLEKTHPCSIIIKRKADQSSLFQANREAHLKQHNKLHFIDIQWIGLFWITSLINWVIGRFIGLQLR